MPAQSQAQRALLNARFGHDWVKKHHFDNRGKLPRYSNRKPMAKPRKHAEKGKSFLADAVGGRKPEDEKTKRERDRKVAMFVKNKH